MKVAVVLLLACVAVSQAAFTAKLSDRTDPIIAQTMFRLRLASRSSGSGMQTEFLAALQQQLQHLVAQAQSIIGVGTGIYHSLVEQIEEVTAQIQALGGQVADGVVEIIGNLASGLLENLANFLGSLGIFGRSNGKGIWDLISQIPSALIGLIQNGFGDWDIGHVLSQLAQQFNIELSPTVVAIITNLWNQLTGHGKSSKGFFDFLDNIGQWISGAAGSLTEQFLGFAASISDQLSASLDILQQAVVQDALEILANAQSIGAASIQEFLNSLRPYAQDLGNLWTQIEAFAAPFLQLIS